MFHELQSRNIRNIFDIWNFDAKPNQVPSKIVKLAQFEASLQYGVAHNRVSIKESDIINHMKSGLKSAWIITKAAPFIYIIKFKMGSS